MKLKSCLLCLGLLLIFILIISNIAFYFFIFSNYEYENNLLLSEIDNNINGRLIKSIEFRKACLGEEEKLTFGFWDGTSEGCSCRKIVYKGLCSDKQVSNHCSALYSNPPISYTILNSNYICATMSKYNYREILKKNKVISKEETCPENYKPCGILDSFGNILCVSIDESCPINSVTIIKKFNDFFNQTKSYGLEYPYSFNNLSNDNETNVHLISQIKLSQYLNCIDPLEKFWDYHYILELPDQRCTKKINGELYDFRYQSISNHSINKYQLYKENSVISKMKDIDELTINKIKEDEVYFFSRYFLGFEYKELEKYDFNYDNLILYQNLANNCNEINKYFLIVVGVSFIGMIALLFDCIEELPKIPIIGGIFKKECLLCLSAFTFIVSFFLSPLFYLIIFIIILQCSKNIKSYLDIKGGDEYTTKLIEIYLKNDISTTIIYTKVIISFCIFILFLFILTIILYCRKKKEKSEKKRNQSDLLLGAFILGAALSRAESDSLDKDSNDSNLEKEFDKFDDLNDD